MAGNLNNARNSVQAANTWTGDLLEARTNIQNAIREQRGTTPLPTRRSMEARIAVLEAKIAALEARMEVSA